MVYAIEGQSAGLEGFVIDVRAVCCGFGRTLDELRGNINTNWLWPAAIDMTVMAWGVNVQGINVLLELFNVTLLVEVMVDWKRAGMTWMYNSAPYILQQWHPSYPLSSTLPHVHRFQAASVAHRDTRVLAT